VKFALVILIASLNLASTVLAGEFDHPASLDFANLKTYLQSDQAPKAALGEFADRCDEDFSEKNARELVKQEPERMHWCFYAKISRLHDNLRDDTRWGVRQKMVTDAFKFLSPIAAAFEDVKHDSNYAEWEKAYSKKTSEWVFFKKIKQTPSRMPASVPISELSHE
jgi:hypothetical protein